MDREGGAVRFKKGAILSALLVAVVAASGCTNVQKGAAAGGAAGAGVGALWAANAGKLNTLEGAGVGMAAGGLVGALIGDALDETGGGGQEESMARRIAMLERDLADRDGELGRLQDELDRMRGQLATKPKTEKIESQDGKFQVEQKNGQIRFTILNEVLFDSGKARLKPQGLATLDEVMEIVGENFADRSIMVEGHTDSDPIRRSKWRSNWELSSGRSLAVLHYLQQEKGMEPDRLSAAAFGEFRPVAPNDSRDGKRQNRRAVIVVQPPEENIVMVRK
jgi:chemotaxis protein MotB